VCSSDLALEAGHTLILNKRDTLVRAKSEDIFIYGMAEDDG